jgi:DnaJ family protein A protein 1
MNVTLDELYNGATRRLSIQKKVLCEKCEGRGTKSPSISQTECSKCRGNGIVTRVEQLGPNIVQRFQTTCDECRGQGKFIPAKDRCKKCEGSKTVKEKKILDVHIDKGMEDGQRVTFSGEGDMEPELEEAGDIIVVLDEKAHDVFKRMQRDDLLMQMELTLTEALCGFQKVITTLDKRNLVITAIPGEVIKHGAVKCVMGEGMPRYKNPYEKGKLIIQFLVKFPEAIDPSVVADLESVLPPRPQVSIPMGEDNVEEVHLMDVDFEQQRQDARRNHGHRAVYDSDGDDDDPRMGPHGAGVQCAPH